MFLDILRINKIEYELKVKKLNKIYWDQEKHKFILSPKLCYLHKPFSQIINLHAYSIHIIFMVQSQPYHKYC